MSIPSGQHPSHDAPTGSLRALCHDPLVVGAVAVAQLVGTQVLFRLSVDVPLLVAGFCGVSLVYLIDRRWTSAPEDRLNHPDRVRWVRAHTDWLTLEASLLTVGSAGVLFFLDGWTLLIASGLGLVALLQVVSFEGGVLRERGIHKPLGIAGAWAIGASVLPIVEAGGTVGTGVLLFAGYRFLFVLPNLLLADWGDRSGDAAAGLVPWAESWTGTQVRAVATGLLCAAAGGGTVWAATGTEPVLVAGDALGALVMIAAVWGLDPHRPTHALVFDLLVGWPLVPAVLAWTVV